MNNISVIVVSWNVKEKLRLCLQSVERNKPLELLVVDNNSSDGSVEMMSNLFPSVKLIVNQENKGFAYACNQAIRLAKGEIILLLNPDSELDENALNQAELFFSRHTRAGIVGGNIHNQDGTIQASVRRLPDLLSQVFIVTKLARVFPWLVRRYMMVDFNYGHDAQVEQVSGALFFVSKKFIEQVGLLDENFFIWFEEVDWCKRAHHKGFEVWYTQTISARHVGGASFVQLSFTQRQRLFNASLEHYFKKHFHYSKYLTIRLFTPISRIESFILDLFHRHV